MYQNPFASKMGYQFCNEIDTTEDYTFKTQETAVIPFTNAAERSHRIYVLKRPSEFFRSVVLGRVRHLKSQCPQFNLVDISARARVTIPYFHMGAPVDGGFKRVLFHIIDGPYNQRDPIVTCEFTKETSEDKDFYGIAYLDNMPPCFDDDGSDGAFYSLILEWDSDRSYPQEKPFDEIGFEIEITVFLTYNFGTSGANFTIDPSYYAVK